MPTGKGWDQEGESMFVKHLPKTTLYVSPAGKTGDWRAEHSESRMFGRLQIDRVKTKEEAMKVCEKWAANEAR